MNRSVEQNTPQVNAPLRGGDEGKVMRSAGILSTLFYSESIFPRTVNFLLLRQLK